MDLALRKFSERACLVSSCSEHNCLRVESVASYGCANEVVDKFGLKVKVFKSLTISCELFPFSGIQDTEGRRVLDVSKCFEHNAEVVRECCFRETVDLGSGNINKGDSFWHDLVEKNAAG